MRYDYLKARAMGPFRDEIFVDFNAIKGELIAVCGENGAGKSTFLEILGGALHRETPTRGTLASMATSRDSFAEVGVTNGAQHVITHTLDGQTGKGTSLVTDVERVPRTADTKVSTFDAWSAAHLPSREVLYASTFLAQASGGFLDLSKADRKKMVLRALGIEHMEADAAAAREQLKATREAIASLDGSLQDERRRGIPSVIEANVQVAIQEGAVKLATGARDDAKLALADAEAAATNVAEALRAWQRTQAEARRLRVTEGALIAKRDDLHARLANNRAVIARRAEIDQAVLDLAAAHHARALAVADAKTTSDSVTRAADEIRRLSRDAENARRQMAAMEQAAATAKAALATRYKVDAAVASLPDLTAEVDRWVKAEAEAHAALAEENEKGLSGAEGRIYHLRGGLTMVVRIERVAGVMAETAKRTLETDDFMVVAAANRPATLGALRLAVTNATAARGNRQAALRTAELMAGKADAVARAEADLAAANAGHVEWVATYERLAGDIRMVEGDRATRQIEAGTHIAASAAAAVTIARLEPLAAKAPALAAAEGRVSELQSQVGPLDVELDGVRAQLSALGDVSGDAPATPDLAGAAARLTESEAVLVMAMRAEATARATLETATASAAVVAELEEQIATLDEDVSDWKRLADDLGPDGLQALEVDAAGPEISATANALLHEAYGPRFTLRLDTVKRDSKNQKDVEVFDVAVLDTQANREGEAKTFSGGERVFLSEALSLSLASFAAKRDGSEGGCTLVRDESGAALDPGRGRAYVSMLRRAAREIGADRILFVTHSPELQALADARIEIADGKVTVTS